MSSRSTILEVQASHMTHWHVSAGLGIFSSLPLQLHCSCLHAVSCMIVPDLLMWLPSLTLNLLITKDLLDSHWTVADLDYFVLDLILTLTCWLSVLAPCRWSYCPSLPCCDSRLMACHPLSSQLLPLPDSIYWMTTSEKFKCPLTFTVPKNVYKFWLELLTC